MTSSYERARPLLDHPFPEPSHFTGYGQNPIVRDSENRSEDSLSEALADPDSRYQLYTDNRILVRDGKAEDAFHFDRKTADAFAADWTRAILLGTVSGLPRVAVPVAGFKDENNADWRALDFRSVLYRSKIPDEEAGAVAQGGSLLAWNASSQYCGKCGTGMQMRIGGYRRDCDHCGNKVFPRTDPVVIMLAIDGENCLLGRSPHFQPGWYSTLAGFVEPGETIEDAVRRETFEESGIQIGRVQYHASQPWPFPHSLMIGVICEALSREITIDDQELEDCRWFSREDVRLMLSGDHPDGLACPPEKAIAHTLVKAWANS